MDERNYPPGTMYKGKSRKEKFVDAALMTGVFVGFAAGAGVVYWWAYNNAYFSHSQHYGGIGGINLDVVSPVKDISGKIFNAFLATPFATMSGLVGSMGGGLLLAGAVEFGGATLDRIANEARWGKKVCSDIKKRIKGEGHD